VTLKDQGRDPKQLILKMSSDLKDTTTCIPSLTTPQNSANDFSFLTRYANITDSSLFVCFSVTITAFILCFLNYIRVRLLLLLSH